ncbi:MAG: hypothetical protein JOY54_20240 [Acidobacteriaceae bacterium]|nr:hypothetical protein [Acidobacteriaceae bacterium]
MISLQTNVDSINAQNNLNINNQLQSKTIQQLTSGYRINSSADDAAGLAVANGYRDDIAELTQGVNNAHAAISQLQIIDGGLSNISTILDRMKTLATESASSTFTGNRATLNQEYQSLIGEITRQASNVNLNSGGSFNTSLSTYIGGANSAANATVSVDLSGTQNAVDATSLGLVNTNVLGAGVGFSGNTQSLNGAGATFLVGAGSSQTFTFNIYGQANAITATVNGSATGITQSAALLSLNNQLNQYGITASIGNNGTLQFFSDTAFTVKDNGTAGAPSNPLTNDAANTTTDNSSLYTLDGAATYAAPAVGKTDTLTITAGGQTVTVGIGNSDGTVAQAVAAINQQTAGIGVYAVANGAGTGISFMSGSSFSISDNNSGAAATGVFGTTGTSNQSSAAPSATTTTANPDAAIAAINNAIQQLGLVQGRVGAGENTLNYAVNLANSQVANFSTTESNIRDANVAQDAADLTKSQVLVQTSIAALAQANAEPQNVLKLLQNL